jgi:F-box protein 21
MYSDCRPSRGSLDHLPDDIIEHVIRYVSPLDNLEGLQLACRRFSRLASHPLLWRYHCRTSFRYWHPRHRIQEKMKSRASEVDWKSLFVTRIGQNKAIARLLEHILASRVGRIVGMQQICTFGYDAKDFLIAQCNVDDSAQDVLARR